MPAALRSNAIRFTIRSSEFPSLFNPRLSAAAKRLIPSGLYEKLDPSKQPSRHFVRGVAAEIPAGKRVLDAGAGEGPFQGALCAHGLRRNRFRAGRSDRGTTRISTSSAVSRNLPFPDAIVRPRPLDRRSGTHASARPRHGGVPASAETGRHGSSRRSPHVGGASAPVRFLSFHLGRHPLFAGKRRHPDSQNSSGRRVFLAAWPTADGRSGIHADGMAMAAVSPVGACFRPGPAAMLLLFGHSRSGSGVHAGLHCEGWKE